MEPGARDVRDALDRVLASYDDIERRFAATGGVGALVDLYQRVRTELDRISHEELDRMAADIHALVDALFQMETEVRKVQRLKSAVEGAVADPGNG